MHVITLPNGLRVDLGAATVSLSSRWTSDDRAKEGLAADIVCASIDAPVITGSGFATVETICDTAGGAARRARVVAELVEKAVARRAELLVTTPCEDLVVAAPPAPVAAKAVRALAKPGALPTPSSNNDEIAKALVKRATYDAAELGDTVVAGNVQCVFEAYVGDNKLSERRAAGVKAKCAALGYVW